MKKFDEALNKINEVVSFGRDLGIGQLYTEDSDLSGRTIRLQGREFLNFGSCSYFGLELDARLKAGAIEAISKYGTQFSSSRAYLSLGLYKEVESLFERIFDQPIILAPTVTLGHLSNLPVITKEGDAVILDFQVHASVAIAAETLMLHRNIHVEQVKHNNLDKLEKRIIELSTKHERVWYLADGVYSTYGDAAPARELYALLEKYPKLHLYIDDSHGMSWEGKNGSGYFLSQVPHYHERLYMVLSTNKCFAAAGGVMVYPNKEIRDYVRNTGRTLIFSGPIQPPMLGAAMASARIHLSPEIREKQKQLRDRINLFNESAKLYELPLIGESVSPIFFVGVGSQAVGYNLVKRLMKKGIFLNLSIYPSVPEKNTGLRMMVNLHHQMRDIDTLLRTIAEELPKALQEEDYSYSDIEKAFRLNHTAKDLIKPHTSEVENLVSKQNDLQ